jgi:hypothetical protein
MSKILRENVEGLQSGKERSRMKGLPAGEVLMSKRLEIL